jgi:glycosyltransferase involved in cell wall biosynthesis
VSARTVLVANPSLDVYGADLQMLESARALVEYGWRVQVAAPTEGPLRSRLNAVGAEVRVMDFPVLRRADASPGGVARLGARAAAALPGMRRAVHEAGADLVYVNTVTLPWWLLAATSTRTPSLCHVHEAEPGVNSLVRRGLTAPLLLADAVMVNSKATMQSMCEPLPRLAPRTRLVYNGVAGPPEPVTSRPRWTSPVRLVSVGRISARKATLDALEVTAALLARGHDVTLEVCGSPIPGQGDYLELVRRRAAAPDLTGKVLLSGYQSPVWPALQRNDVFLATSTAEPLGNAVLESQLAGRPVVATAVEGHLETVIDGETGLLCPVNDPASMADQVAALIEDPELAGRVALAAGRRAVAVFGIPRYQSELLEVCEGLTAAPTASRRFRPRR